MDALDGVLAQKIFKLLTAKNHEVISEMGSVSVVFPVCLVNVDSTKNKADHWAELMLLFLYSKASR